MPKEQLEFNIRPFKDTDWLGVWKIIHEVIQPGDTYDLDPGTPEEAAKNYWLHPGHHVWVACRAEHPDQILGSYILRANRPGLGAHIANASYMVGQECRGLGIGKALGQHSIAQAKQSGFKGMQFNFVISTNKAALRLWQKLGFKIIGTTPKGYYHLPQKQYVDTHILYRALDD